MVTRGSSLEPSGIRTAAGGVELRWWPGWTSPIQPQSFMLIPMKYCRPADGEYIGWACSWKKLSYHA